MGGREFGLAGRKGRLGIQDDDPFPFLGKQIGTGQAGNPAADHADIEGRVAS